MYVLDNLWWILSPGIFTKKGPGNERPMHFSSPNIGARPIQNCPRHKSPLQAFAPSVEPCWKSDFEPAFLFMRIVTESGGALNFFSGRGMRPGFLKCGDCELILGLWKRGLVNYKFPNLWASELKISKFGGFIVSWKFPNLGALWAKILAKIEAVEAKMSKFSQKGVLLTDSFAWNEACELQERCENGVFRTAHPHTPFLGQCPQGLNWFRTTLHTGAYLGPMILRQHYLARLYHCGL